MRSTLRSRGQSYDFNMESGGGSRSLSMSASLPHLPSGQQHRHHHNPHHPASSSSSSSRSGYRADDGDGSASGRVLGAGTGSKSNPFMSTMSATVAPRHREKEPPQLESGATISRSLTTSLSTDDMSYLKNQIMLSKHKMRQRILARRMNTADGDDFEGLLTGEI